MEIETVDKTLKRTVKDSRLVLQAFSPTCSENGLGDAGSFPNSSNDGVVVMAEMPCHSPSYPYVFMIFSATVVFFIPLSIASFSM